MYSPEDVENFIMLSSYLRTTPEKLGVLTYGQRNIVDYEDLKSFAKLPKKTVNSTEYRKFYIPKKNKKLGYRIVYKCYQQFTIDTLKILKFNLTILYKPHDSVHGFVHGRSTKSNAQPHLGMKHLLSLDIKNFFESINQQTVTETFKSLGFKDNIAAELATICTLEKKLVQGFPTSPIVANIVCCEMDEQIQKLCVKYKATYTRYADDISISSNEFTPPIDDIKAILKSFQFELNDLKTKKFKRGQNQFVTGLSIADTSYPRIPKAVKKRIRQQLYYIKKYGYHSHICKIMNLDIRTDTSITSPIVREIENNLKGWISYIFSIEPLLANEFYVTFNENHDLYYAELFAKHKLSVIGLDLTKPITLKF